MPPSLMTRIPWHIIVVGSVLCISVYIVFTMSDLHRLLDLRIESLRGEFLAIQHQQKVRDEHESGKSITSPSHVSFGDMKIIHECEEEGDGTIDDNVVTSVITHFLEYDEDDAIDAGELYEEYSDSSSSHELPKAEVIVLDEEDEIEIVDSEEEQNKNGKELSNSEEEKDDGSENTGNHRTDEKSLRSMKVEQLRQILKNGGYETTGLKEVLLKRIVSIPATV